MLSTFKTQNTQTQYLGLDLLRGGAALLVLASHTRAFVIKDFSEVGNVGPLGAMFYFVTGLGHQAVMVFFVLSGFFISKSISNSIKNGSWSLAYYLVDRLSRMWVVLLPGLIFTFVFDWVGWFYFSPEFYLGNLSYYHSGPPPIGGAQYDLHVLLGNMLFLQGIYVPVFGSNGPLWSLCNEFWYYMLFPLAYSICSWRVQPTMRIISLGIVILIGSWLPLNLMMLWPVWLLGFLAFKISESVYIQNLAPAPFLFLSSGGLVGALILSEINIASSYLLDMLVGAAAAVIIIALMNVRLKSYIAWIAASTAKVSFSIYIFHFPIAAVLAAAFLKNNRLSPAAEGYAWFAFFVLVEIIVCIVFYAIFERYTGRVRAAMRGLVVKAAPRTTNTAGV
jgi:peptidoglycan/LPS O-acetylase OafA/YrhL